MKLRLAGLLMLLTLLNAQESQQGTISGFITDPSRAAVPRAQVTVTNEATKLFRTAESNDAGLYSFAGLQLGTYNVKVSFSGFKGEERTGIVLDVGASVRIDFVMEIGSLTEVVSVAATVPVLKTETGEVSNLISGTQVTELGLNGRNFTQFLSLGTGVVSQQTGHQMGLGQEGNPLMAVNGGRISMNKYSFDGTLAMDTGGNRGLDIFPPLEAISEISVQKSNYGQMLAASGPQWLTS